MKFTLNWLREFVDLPTDDAVEITDALADLGFALEAMEPLSVDFSDVVVTKVVQVRLHPNADKVRLATLDDGSSETEVVCGAWNFEAGAVVAWAKPGSVLAGGFKVGEKEIRGVNSPGMIASERELGLGDDHEGILVLGPDVAVGTDFATLVPYPDTAIEVEVNPNRPDCMSVVGLARELAAKYRVPLKEPVIDLPDLDGGPSVEIQDPDGCPRFVARRVQGVSIGPSPMWLRLRLRAVGVRPITNAVDATNYAMIELGHPTHGFDANKLGDSIVLRRAEAGEKLTTLDDSERVLEPSDIVVATPERAVAVAGVMGGAETEVGEDTTEVIVEAAYFDPASVLFTAQRLGLHSEASSRFQRGMDPNAPRRAADRVAQLLVEHAAGTLGGVTDAYPVPIEPWDVELPLAEIERVTGTAFTSADVVDILQPLGFGTSGDDPLTVTVPTRRPDVSRSVDFVEEVARFHGYDNFPSSVATGPGEGLSVEQRRYRLVSQAMVGAGFHEAITFSFIGQADLDRLGLPSGDPRRAGIRLVNPLREEEGVMRTTLLPGLLKAAEYNTNRQISQVALFETGKVFLPTTDDIPAQPEALAFIAVGSAGGGWFGPGLDRDILDATGAWEMVTRAMGVADRVSTRPTRSAPFHPERAAEVAIDGQAVGVVGELHPRVARAFNLGGRVAAGELMLEALLADPGLWQYRPAGAYPPVVFDLAFECEESVSAAQLVEAIRSSGGELLEKVEVFDEFRGDPLPAGSKSLAFHLTIRALDRTLTDEEVAPIRQAIAASAESATGAKLRTA